MPDPRFFGSVRQIEKHKKMFHVFMIIHNAIALNSLYKFSLEENEKLKKGRERNKETSFILFKFSNEL